MDIGRVVLSLLCLAVSAECRGYCELRCGWLTRCSHDVAPKGPFEKTFERVYQHAESGFSSPPINPQDIALVFIIMAQGTVFNIEMPNCDSSTEEWLHLSERALVKGEFLSNNMVAGLQTLVSFQIWPCFLSIANVSASDGTPTPVRIEAARSSRPALLTCV